MGFHFKETMIGTLSPTGDPETQIKAKFTVVCKADSYLSYAKDLTVGMYGTVTVEGICKDRPVAEGTLEINPVLRRRLVYRFTFEDGQGHHYRFYGIKRIRWIKAAFTWTTLYSTLFRDGEQIANGVLYFRWRDMPAFLLNWRPVSFWKPEQDSLPPNA